MHASHTSLSHVVSISMKSYLLIFYSLRLYHFEPFELLLSVWFSHDDLKTADCYSYWCCCRCRCRWRWWCSDNKFDNMYKGYAIFICANCELHTRRRAKIIFCSEMGALKCVYEWVFFPFESIKCLLIYRDSACVCTSQRLQWPTHTV